MATLIYKHEKFKLAHPSFSMFDQLAANNCSITPLTDMSGCCPEHRSYIEAAAKRGKQFVVASWPLVGDAVLIYPRE